MNSSLFLSLWAVSTLFITSPYTLKGQNVSMQELWTSDAFLDTPESVHYSEDQNLLYVSCIGGKTPTEKDGNGFISLLNMDGSLHTLKWVEGLNAPKGMDIMDGKLYVTDIDHFVVIDIASASIEKKIPVDNAVFLNDVACDEPEHCVYFSDSNSGIVYKYDQQGVSIFFKAEEVTTVNGVFNTKHILYLGGNDLLALDKKSKKHTILVKDTKQIDGLEQAGKNVFIGTNWEGRIMALIPGKTLITLENSAEKGYNTADIGMNRKAQIFYVPTFFTNTVKAYSYTIE